MKHYFSRLTSLVTCLVALCMVATGAAPVDLEWPPSSAVPALTIQGGAIGDPAGVWIYVRRGTTNDLTSVLDDGVLVYDTTNDRLRVGDGATVGGLMLLASGDVSGSVSIPVSIAEGGTGSTNALDARNALGLEIGADVQAHSAVLDATTASFTTADESKLDAIESGAQVNVVSSVNSLTGAVVLDPDDLDDAATTHKFTTASAISKLAGIESGAQVNVVTSVAGRIGAITLSSGDVSGIGTMGLQSAGAVSITGGAISGITDLAISDGGTGASTATDALLNLGYVPYEVFYGALSGTSELKHGVDRNVRIYTSVASGSVVKLNDTGLAGLPYGMRFIIRNEDGADSITVHTGTGAGSSFIHTLAAGSWAFYIWDHDFSQFWPLMTGTN